MTSIYARDEFEGVPNLCVSNEGREFAVQGVDNSSIDEDIMVVTKYKNSVIHSDRTDELLDLIRTNHILICGVTTTSCIQHCVFDLADCCASVSLGLNAVGCRLTKTAERQHVLDRFGTNPQVSVHDTWEEAVGIGVAGTHNKSHDAKV